MPTKTFFNLPKEKQEVLMLAARKEFMSYPLNEVSINRIITDAKIPRGSFYMYFEDKEDLYRYFIETKHSKIMRKVENIIKESNGDFFEAVELAYECFSSITLSEEYQKYFNNIIISIHTSTQKKLITKKPVLEVNQIIEKINYDTFNCEKEYAYDIIDATVNYLIRILIKVLNGFCTKEQGKKHLNNFIEAIKYGIYKEEKDA